MGPRARCRGWCWAASCWCCQRPASGGGVQENRVDLQSRLEALEILQDRLAQMQQYRSGRPWSLGLGLYQGQAIE
ncbi:MAG: hypothetical protein H7225_17855, partial [Massilia sp.]